MMKKLFFTPLLVPFIAFVVLCDVSVAHQHGKHRGHGPCNQSAYFIKGKLIAPEIGVRTAVTGKTVIKKGKHAFKDSNGNGMLEPYEDWRRSPLNRAKDLIARMTVEEKIGLLVEFWDFGTPAVDSKGDAVVSADVVAAVEEDHIRYSICRWPDDVDAAGTATYYNAIQELCEATPLGIPAVIFSDPVHQAGNNETSEAYVGANNAEALSDYPYPIAFAAINDKRLIKKIAAEHAAEYRACGVRALLGPMADLATEPMWARVYDTYGTDGAATGMRAKAYIQGLQGAKKGVNPFTGVAATLKHFPGAGADEGGMDSHTEPGRFNVYPGDNFKEHLKSMKIALKANPACVMPCYSIFEDVVYKGRAFEQVGSAHAKTIMLDLLRGKLGWNGMVTSDWGAVGSRAWGLVNFGKTDEEILASFVDAGGHQVGQGAVAQWKSAYAQGLVSEENISRSALKVLEVAFKVGAFENPYADPMKANRIIASHHRSAVNCQLKAMTLLKNQDFVLPVKSDQGVGDASIQVYFDTIYEDSDTDTGTNFLSDYLSMLSAATGLPYETAGSLAGADVAVIRISARRGNYFGGNGGVPISFSDQAYGYNQAIDGPDETIPYVRMFPFPPFQSPDPSLDEAQGELAKIQDAIDAKAINPNLKIIVVMFTPRPAVVTEFLDDIDALLCEFGADDVTVFDMVFQARSDHHKSGTTFLIDSVRPAPRLEPKGRLPWNFPSSQEAVYNQYEDVPNDDRYPTFAKGAGMGY
ncbi:MAG: glycoside hydrolase family 3 N-terminal domain-containing protein [Desulfobacteraceae bacterium]|jgi:beta-glucosidase